MKRCGCPSKGVMYPGQELEYNLITERPYVNHEPGECKCTNDLALYEREGKKLWLCSCCWLSGDKRIKE